MGKPDKRKLKFLAALLLCIAVLANIPISQTSVDKIALLEDAVVAVKGYSSNVQPLEQDIIDVLELDDYIQARFSKPARIIDLYIGYYFTMDKISSAHSPLVCFPGQGWAIETPTQKSMVVAGNTINYEEMVASKNGQKTLVIFWYQAGKSTNTKVFANKLTVLANRLTGRGLENGFVKVSTPFSGNPEDRTQAEQAIKQFINSFYPKFLSYIDETNAEK